MRTMNFILSLCCICFAVSLSSCQKDDNIYYSCNGSIDKWVKTNMAKIQKMDRQSWLAYPDTLLIPMYRAFTVEQKMQIWVNKLEDILNVEDWNGKEREHLLILKKKIESSPEWFANTGLEQNDKMYEDYKLFFYRWNKYAMQELNWDKEKILFIAYTAKGKSQVTRSGIVDEIGQESDIKIPDCDCKVGNVLFTLCSGSLYCEEILCNQSNHGCGAVWVESCDGLCVSR